MTEIYNSSTKTFTVPDGAVSFKVVVHGKGLADLASIGVQLNSGDDVAPDLTGQIAITSEWGDALVYSQDEIKQADQQLTIPLYEPIWVKPTATGTASGGQGFKMDGFNLYQDFGMVISEVNNLLDIPKRIDVGTTDYYKLTQYRESGVINLTGIFESNGTGTLKENINKFYALMSSPGARSFVMPDNSTFYVYSADGCQVSDIQQNIASFKMTLRKTTSSYSGGLMSESGGVITSEDGQLITTEEGQLTTTQPQQAVNYGRLYNWYAATDSRNIANTGWHAPTDTEWATLATYLGGANIAGDKLKEIGPAYWANNWEGFANNGTNEAGFNGRGAGANNGIYGFDGLLTSCSFWTSTDGNYSEGGYSYSWTHGLYTTSAELNRITSVVFSGRSIRPLKDSTTLIHGQTGTYIGNDGRAYRTICIGTQEWLSENLAETKYRDLSLIPEVTDNAAWSALTTGAQCVYENNEINL